MSHRCQRSTGGVKLTLDGNKMRFESESPESGEGFDEVAVDYDGGDVTVGFNARYFLDVLAPSTTKKSSSASAASSIPPWSGPAPRAPTKSYLAVMMPMRI